MSYDRKRRSSQGVARRLWSAWLRFGSPRIVAEELHMRESQSAKEDRSPPPNSIGISSGESQMEEAVL
ncbi:MAG: hypothetical protein OXG24_04325 [Gammaproteobacteria bacterium]|nr:hypothetical protein [Gammaproteobacteria bacterium]